MRARRHPRLPPSSWSVPEPIAGTDVRHVGQHSGPEPLLSMRRATPQAQLIRGGQVPLQHVHALSVGERLRLGARYYALLMADLYDALVERWASS